MCDVMVCMTSWCLSLQEPVEGFKLTVRLILCTTGREVMLHKMIMYIDMVFKVYPTQLSVKNILEQKFMKVVHSHSQWGQ